VTTTTRLTALGALTCLLLSAFTLVAPTANAAWTNWVTIHGSKAQVCKVPLSGGTTRVKVRLDNRGAAHAHRVSLFRDRNGSFHEVAVRAAAGAVSGVNSLVLARGDEAGVTTHDPNGAAGDMLRLSVVARC